MSVEPTIDTKPGSDTAVSTVTPGKTNG
jgi:hypothetical protein